MARAIPAASGLPRLFTVDRNAVNIAEGVRAALSTALIVAAGEWLSWEPLHIAALAAWLTCLGDPGGPIRSRAPALMAFALFGAAIFGCFSLLRGFAPLVVVVPLAAAGVFCAMFARVWGQAAMQVGNLLTAALVLALRDPVTDPREAAVLAGMFLAGSLWALLMTMGLWRIYPHLPTRRAVGECFRALAVLTQDLRMVAAHPEADEATWERHARAHRRLVREKIERARALVLATARERGNISRRSTQAAIRLEAADQIFGALIGLSDVLEPAAAADRAASDRVLRRLRQTLMLLGRYVVNDRTEQLPLLQRAVGALAATAPADPTIRTLVERIVERIRVTITLATPDRGPPGPAAGDNSDIPWRIRVLGPVQANLDRNSAVLRHALRAAVAGAVAFAITLTWPGPYEYWMTITLMLTLQPFFALTIGRAVERVGGTIVGGLIAAVLALVCNTPLSVAIGLFPLAIVAFALRAVSFGLFVACITPIVVLLVEAIQPGASELEVAAMRALYTLIGGALAVLANVVLWPSWEPDRLAREIRAAIGAHGRFARADIQALLGEASPADVERARREAGLASNNVEASLQRAMVEPRGDGAAIEAALTIDAALRRMAGRLSALQLDLALPHTDRAAWIAWRDWIDTATAALSAGQSDLPPRPALPRDDPHTEALVRIGRQLELSAGAVARLGA
jgi:uncharacterized membrane protein YccC